MIPNSSDATPTSPAPEGETDCALDTTVDQVHHKNDDESDESKSDQPEVDQHEKQEETQCEQLKPPQHQPEPQQHQPEPQWQPSKHHPNDKVKKIIKAAGWVLMVAGGAAALTGGLVLALGFKATGILAGSCAAKMMSASAVANGGGVAAGSAVSALQSFGATTASYVLAAGSTTAAAGGAAAYASSERDKHGAK